MAQANKETSMAPDLTEQQRKALLAQLDNLADLHEAQAKIARQNKELLRSGINVLAAGGGSMCW